MTGFLGFIAAAAVFGLYALSLNMQFKTHLRLKSFKLAYLLLAAACIGWAAGLISNDPDMLRGSVVLGNVLLLGATIALVDTVIAERHRRKTALALSILALALVYARIAYFSPAPYISNDILIFNTQKEVATILGAIFVGVWLPVSLFVSRRLTENIRVIPMQSLGALSYIMATLGVMVFLSARRPLTVVLSFGVLCLSFASLTGINYLKKKAQ